MLAANGTQEGRVSGVKEVVVILEERQRVVVLLLLEVPVRSLRILVS